MTPTSPFAGGDRARLRTPWFVGLVAMAALDVLGLVLIAEGIARTIGNQQATSDLLVLTGAGCTLRAAARAGSTVLAQRLANAQRERLRRLLLARVLDRGRIDLDTSEGELIWLGTSGVTALDTYATAYQPALATAMVVPVALWLRVLFADPMSAGVIALTVPLIPVFMWLIGTYTEERVQRSVNAVARLSSHVVELARGLPVLVGLHRAEDQTRAFRDIGERVRKQTVVTLRTAFLSSLALELIATISVALVAVGIGFRLVHGSMALTTGVLVLILAPDIFRPLRDVGSGFHAAEEGVEARERIERVVATPTPDRPLDGGGGMQVTWAGRERALLEDMSLQLPERGVVAVTGASGAGKSTLLAAIGGWLHWHPTVDVSGLAAISQPGRMGWCPQRPTFAAETVREELALYGVGDASRALTAVAASHLIDGAIAELSLGEQRRIAMARVLGRADVDVLLLDEPTAHLDTGTASVIRATMTAAARERLVIVATHDPAVIAEAAVHIPLGDGTTGTVDGDGAPAPEAQRQRAPRTEGFPMASWRDAWRVLDMPGRQTALAFLLGLIAAGMAIALTAVSGWLIVRASQQPPIMYLMVAIVGVRFFGLGRAAARYAERLLMHNAVLMAATDLRVRVWRALAAGAIQQPIWRGSGRAMDVLIGRIDDVRDMAPRAWFPPAIGIAIIGIAALLLAPWLGITSAVLVVVLAIAVVLTIMRARQGEQAARARESLHRFMGNVITAAADLRLNDAHPAAMAGLRDRERDLAAADAADARREGGTEAIVMIALGSALLVGMWESGGRLPSPTLAAALLLMLLGLTEPLLEMVSAGSAWRRLGIAASEVQAVLGTQASQASKRADGVRIESIAMRGGSAVWPDGSTAFSDLSFRASKGTWTVVRGLSGTGKSSALAVLLGMLPLQRGDLTTNVTPQAPDPRRIAWVPQEPHIFDSTVRGNLMLAIAREEEPTDDRLWQVLDRVGLGTTVRGMSEGLETRVGPMGDRLSGGERQRLAVARALLLDADVLLLDEPTAHLDLSIARDLLSDLRAGTRDTIVIMVTHADADVNADDDVVTMTAAR